MSKTIPEIIQDYLAKGDATGWFEEIYSMADANDSQPPWANMQADPNFVQWAEKTKLKGEGCPAVVIGCGLGDDAEYLAGLGFDVTAFDVSPTAIEIANKRFPESSVAYQVADLFNPPESWIHSFDFVFENRTIQALPVDMEIQSKTAVAKLVSAQGHLLILCQGRDNNDPKRGIPWSLSREDLQFFAGQGMLEKVFEDHRAGHLRRFLVLYKNNLA